ncbi:hypothetical protein LOTGIDRAFT_156908 [Lottia gigantea]|uniref:Uncharacterized protein n=1 Tax=Lottia gigantea TaxID=225164 RepID=V4BAH2_LOTGI|nr:hypothetical protein LOTGIDRAFT_156908 [Lottia gigantea]ESP02952.1 hypothetical protein LOTGIDRAFT_156908 [Lottia gigantea]
MDVHISILGMVFALICFSNSALIHKKDTGDREFKNLMSLTSTTEKMLKEISRDNQELNDNEEFKTYDPKLFEGHRLRLLKRMVKTMERRRPRRNILGILKDSVSNNLSDLLLHALDEEPPSDYKFRGNLWKYSRDPAWGERESKQSQEKNVDPMMNLIGLGKR